MTTPYQDFLKTKQVTVPDAGVVVDRSRLHPDMFGFQAATCQYNLRKGRSAAWLSTGLGKALDSNTRVVTPNGFQEIGSLSVDDFAIGCNGKPVRVIGVFPQGIRQAYRVTFSDGTSVVCDINHLWSVRTRGHSHLGRPFRTMALHEIMDLGIGSSGEERRGRWFIPTIDSPVEFAECDLPIHPYVLGVLLGDGHIRHGNVSISSADVELINHVSDLLPDGYEITKKRYHKYDYHVLRSGDISSKDGGVHGNQIIEALRDMGVYGLLAHEKHIPDCYKFSNADTRLELLRGLFDTDGSIWTARRTPVVEYSSSSPQLADDVRFIIQSLGGKTSMNVRKTNRRDSYRMVPSFPVGMNPFWLPRKAELWKGPSKYLPKRSIRKIEQVEDRDMTCITVESADGLFVVDHCIVTHNSLISMEYARIAAEETNGRALMVEPLAVAYQMLDEAKKFGIEVAYAKTQSDAAPAGITITNYERLDAFDNAAFEAMVVGESSILKGMSSVTRAKLTAFAKQIPYRLAETATPAPNDLVELANHAEFLGVSTRGRMLSTYFINQQVKGGGKAGWRLKGHARKAFFRWLASWAMSIRVPSDIGFDDAGFILPPLCIEPVIIRTDILPTDRLLWGGLKGIQDRSQIRHATLDDKVAAAAELIAAEPDEQWLIWVGLNDEAKAIGKALSARGLVSDEVEGADDAEVKAQRLLAFAHGNIRRLVTKPKIASHGMNFQRCARMIFIGISDSFESYFQCLRRCWRYGQTRPVYAYVVFTEIEGDIYNNLLRKEKQAEELSRELIAEVREFEKEELGMVGPISDIFAPRETIKVPAWLGGL